MNFQGRQVLEGHFQAVYIVYDRPSPRHRTIRLCSNDEDDDEMMNLCDNPVLYMV